MHQFIESVETEIFVDDLSQAQQQQESQHQTVEVKTVETIEQERQQLQSPEPEQLLSTDSPIKMVDIYAMQEELKWSVISEIEGHKLNDGTMESEQICSDSIKKFDTFRGGTESLLFNASAIIFPESDDTIMETIMFGAQTAKQFQSDDQKYQDDMKGNPEMGVKHKTQKSVKFQIEEDKVLEAYVTHWQELETHARIQQWQEQEQQDHNFRHGAENSSHDYTMASTRPTVSRLAGV
jgi:hypothetical protein